MMENLLHTFASQMVAMDRVLRHMIWLQNPLHPNARFMNVDDLDFVLAKLKETRRETQHGNPDVTAADSQQGR